MFVCECVSVYTYLYMHTTTINKEAVYLKDSKKGCMGEFKKRKGKKEMVYL